MIKISLKYVLLSLVFLCVLQSNAYALGTYLGGGLGNASYDIKPLSDSNSVEDGVALKGFIGTQKDYLGVEAEISVSSHDWTQVNGNATHNILSLIFSGVGYLPITDGFELYGKVGLNLWSTTVDYFDQIYEGDDGIDLAFGVGLKFVITEKFQIRLEMQQMPGIGDGLDEGDVSQISFNVAFTR